MYLGTTMCSYIGDMRFFVVLLLVGFLAVAQYANVDVVLIDSSGARFDYIVEIDGCVAYIYINSTYVHGGVTNLDVVNIPTPQGRPPVPLTDWYLSIRGKIRKVFDNGRSAEGSDIVRNGTGVAERLHVGEGSSLSIYVGESIVMIYSYNMPWRDISTLLDIVDREWGSVRQRYKTQFKPVIVVYWTRHSYTPRPPDLDDRLTKARHELAKIYDFNKPLIDEFGRNVGTRRLLLVLDRPYGLVLMVSYFDGPEKPPTREQVEDFVKKFIELVGYCPQPLHVEFWHDLAFEIAIGSPAPQTDSTALGPLFILILVAVIAVVVTIWKKL